MFRFTIRDVLWLTAVAAVAGWLAIHRDSYDCPAAASGFGFRASFG